MILVVFLVSSWNFNASAQNVNFPDANLAAVVRTKLGLAEGADIPQASLAAITSLYARDEGITDLTGLEHATELTRLTLPKNSISDISPISNLTNLTNINLSTNSISDISPISNLTNLTSLNLSTNSISDISPISNLTNLTFLNIHKNYEIRNIDVLSGLTQFTTLAIGYNKITDISRLSQLTSLTQFNIEYNRISDISVMSNFGSLSNSNLSGNPISDFTPLSGLTSLTRLYLQETRISDLTPLSTLTSLKYLYLRRNRISNLNPLSSLTALVLLYLEHNNISDLSPLETLTELEVLEICYNPYTNISPIAQLVKLRTLEIDEEFVNANRALVEATTDAKLRLCPLLPDPPIVESEPESEPASKAKRRRSITQCGLGWSPQSQYQHFEELPKVMIYALEFEYDPAGHGRYICKAIEIRTGDDSIENLAGWNLYLGTLYNPSIIPITIPEAHSQVTDNVLRITPEMLGLETFPCNTVGGISHPLPGVQYVLKTDENILVDTAYSCFIWGQNAYTTVNGVNVESPRRISSAALRDIDTPRIERYIMKPNSVFITYMDIEAFTWDRVVLSDWLLPPIEASVPGGPSMIRRKLVTTWGLLKKQ